MSNISIHGKQVYVLMAGERDSEIPVGVYQTEGEAKAHSIGLTEPWIRGPFKVGADVDEALK